ncbi:hypothetical protein BH11PLA1_BH11PLA1_17000 [soil metagenome]
MRTRPLRRAVALVDAIVATIILGVALSVLVSLSARAIASQSQGEKLQTAALLADEQLNLVLARGFEDYAKRFRDKASCDPPFNDFAYALTFVGGESGGCATVTCTISWLGTGGKSESASVQTLIAPRVGDDPDPDRKPPDDLVPQRLVP